MRFKILWFMTINNTNLIINLMLDYDYLYQIIDIIIWMILIIQINFLLVNFLKN